MRLVQRAVPGVGVGALQRPERLGRGVEGDVVVLHGTADFLERQRRPGGDRLYFRVHGKAAEVGVPAELQPGDAALRGGEVVVGSGAECVGIAGVPAGEHLQHERGVAHGAGQRAVLAEVIHGGWHAGAGVARHAPQRGLDPVHTAEARRPADRAAAVAALRQRAQPGGHRGRAAAARPAGAAIGIPGISAGIPQTVGGVADEPELRTVGLAEHDGSGTENPLHGERVRARHVVAEDERALRRPHTAGVFRVLDRHRDAVQRPQRVAAHHRILGGPCRAQRALPRDGQIGTQSSVEALDPLAIQLHKFAWRHFPCEDAAALLQRPGKSEIVIHGHVLRYQIPADPCSAVDTARRHG